VVDTSTFLLSLSVKEFLKSVKIWQSHCHPKFWGLGFFETQCTVYSTTLYRRSRFWSVCRLPQWQ